MKPLLLFSALMFLFFSAAFGQNSDAEKIKQLNRDWLNAYITKDTAVLSNVLADDFFLIAYNGLKQNRTDLLQLAADTNVQTVSVSFDSVSVEMITPAVGILNAWVNYIFKANGKELKGKNCYQDIYMKRNNKWVAVAAHVTSLDSCE